MDLFYLAVGKAVCVLAGLAAVWGVGCLLGMLSFLAIRFLISCYGGMKFFKQYTEWYHSEERTKWIAKIQSRVSKESN